MTNQGLCDREYKDDFLVKLNYCQMDGDCMVIIVDVTACDIK